MSVDLLRKTFNNNGLLDIKSRIEILRNIYQFLEKEEDNILDCMYKDLGKPKQEAFASEIAPVKYEINHIISNINHWSAEKRVSKTFVFATDDCYVTPQPLGVVLTISSWNYPFLVPLSTCVGAIAAGNTVLIKPSELAPISEHFLKSTLGSYVDKNYVDVFCGGPEETSKLLRNERFDFIIYTGGKTVGKIVMKAAAENLTPVCLELGGKCPVYVDESADLSLTASRLVWGKFLNCGQTCIGPDYVLCAESIQKELINLMKQKIREFFGQTPSNSDNYGRIINKAHTKRLGNLINETKGKICLGGNLNLDEKFVEPAIISNVTTSDALMQDEIFGPLLPIVTVKDCRDAIRIVNENEKPLSIYVFSGNSLIFNVWKKNTSSGSLVFNDCVIQGANPLLPFGGVGGSGFGAYKGKHSFNLFSHKRAVVNKSTLQSADYFRLPPYTEKTFAWSKWAMKNSSCSIM